MDITYFAYLLFFVVAVFVSRSKQIWIKLDGDMSWARKLPKTVIVKINVENQQKKPKVILSGGVGNCYLEYGLARTFVCH